MRTAADCRLWVMDRAIYNAIKHTAALQLAAEKCAMVAAVPMLSVLSQVGAPPPLDWAHAPCCPQAPRSRD